MAIHGGAKGVVDGVSAVRNWQISDDGQLSRFVNSATALGSGRRKGIQQWNGNYACHGAVPAHFPGEFFTFLGYTAPDDNVSGVGLTYGGEAVVDAIGINWDWASGNVIEHSLGFSGHLALTATAADTEVLDATVSDPEPVGVTKIAYSANGSDFTDLTDLTQASLQIQAANSSYVNSSTASGTGRIAGPIDWTASINIESSVMGHGLTKFNDYVWRFYVTATTYYELKWGQVKGYTGLVINPETGQVISHTINIEMNATKSAALGFIKKPGAVTWWPAS